GLWGANGGYELGWIGGVSCRTEERRRGGTICLRDDVVGERQFFAFYPSTEGAQTAKRQALKRTEGRRRGVEVIVVQRLCEHVQALVRVRVRLHIGKCPR